MNIMSGKTNYLLENRSFGILMHLTSLPGKYGTGDLGPEAFDFISSLAECSVRFWQILPLGPTGYGNSPYSSQSAFAGNELLISPQSLEADGWLTPEETEDSAGSETRVDFEAVKKRKMPLLFKAAERALKDTVFCRQLEEFRKKNSCWLEDYALFRLLYDRHNSACWKRSWPEDEAHRNPETLRLLREENREILDIYEAVQFFFDIQIKKLRRFAKENNVALIGDIPIFVGMDSADTWADSQLFGKDVAGVPPDNFSATGQLWGNPVYNWDYHLKTDFRWWLARIERCMEMTDVLRIDHFRGFCAYYSIDAKAPTAEHGTWTPSPGKELFATVRKVLGQIPIIAEDLGTMTPDVVELRTSNGFPGMKIAQFGFAEDEDGNLDRTQAFLAENFNKDFVAYTGTHDNDTTAGWFNSLDSHMKELVLRYLDTDAAHVTQSLITRLCQSRANMVVIPMQDILNLDSSARMNYPSTCNNTNWTWRMEKNAFGKEQKDFIRTAILSSDRAAVHSAR